MLMGSSEPDTQQDESIEMSLEDLVRYLEDRVQHTVQRIGSLKDTIHLLQDEQSRLKEERESLMERILELEIENERLLRVEEDSKVLTSRHDALKSHVRQLLDQLEE